MIKFLSISISIGSLLFLTSCVAPEDVSHTADTASPGASVDTFSSASSSEEASSLISEQLPKPSIPNIQSPDISIVAPNGGEKFTMSSNITIRYKISNSLKKKISKNMLIELYLLRTDGIVEGYIGGVTDISKASYVWRPEKLQHNGGLDTTEQSPGPGEYRVLLLIRNKTPSNGIEDPVDILTDEFDTFDGENILIPDGSKGQPDYAHPFILPLLASDVSDAAFVLQ